MKILNKEKFLEVLKLVENYEKNKFTYHLDLEETKSQLDQLFRNVQTALCKDNDEFTSYFTENINYETSIADKIEELNSVEEIEGNEKETLQSFFSLYYSFLLGEIKEIAKIIGINEKKEKMQELISTLKLFQEEKHPLLTSVYQRNKQGLDENIELLEAMNFSLSNVPEETSSSSNKGKGKEVSQQENFDWIKSLSEEEKVNTIIEQMRVLEEKNIIIDKKNEEIRSLEEQVTILQNQLQQIAQIQQVQYSPK
ncbi:hypothetical protein [endosymbiont GvMRE of Glomus versiforme]|uniref:hypothetical protein n=1 Tax=endosymbiont GvMRE of Glomus versiforme TaxID=2039283 RepID=UPI000EE8FC90|nr:hypothetical protein [endosymbiont GvMRE of Glomus versiforme]RHZ37002.1 hypothetical protein GvMRE_I2g124 [endosymbiont GvMRE of Glomus versiforme]